jgi:hypothetical protein
MQSVVYDAAGHRRSLVTMPGFHEGRAPRKTTSARAAIRGPGSGDVRALGASAHAIDELIGREAVLKQALLVDVTVGVDRLWQVALGLLDHVAWTYSG